MAQVRVLVADDHGIVRSGLALLLERQADITVVGEASDGRAAAEAALRLAPDVLIVDITMPGMTGTEVTAQLKATMPALKIVALSVHEELSYVRALLDAGADSYVLKRSAGEVLISAIRSAVAGEPYLDPSLTPVISHYLTRRSPSTSGAPSDVLSEREDEVMRLLARGYASKEIAADLGLSSKTVDTYRARGMEKLGLTSRAALVRYALKQGWLTDEQ